MTNIEFICLGLIIILLTLIICRKYKPTYIFPEVLDSIQQLEKDAKISDMFEFQKENGGANIGNKKPKSCNHNIVYHKGAVSITTPIPTMDYIDWVMGLNSFKTYVMAGLSKSGKELSESAAAVKISTQSLFSRGVDTRKEENRLCLAIGDGITPRTGGLFALLTKFRVLSIDPIMGNSDKTWIGEEPHEIKRLYTFRMKIEEWIKQQSINPNIEELVVLQVHSHASLHRFYPDLNLLFPKANITTIAIPCCKTQYINGLVPISEYEDWSILSEKRTVKIYIQYYIGYLIKNIRFANDCEYIRRSLDSHYKIEEHKIHFIIVCRKLTVQYGNKEVKIFAMLVGDFRSKLYLSLGEQREIYLVYEDKLVLLANDVEDLLQHGFEKCKTYIEQL